MLKRQASAALGWLEGPATVETDSLDAPELNQKLIAEARRLFARGKVSQDLAFDSPLHHPHGVETRGARNPILAALDGHIQGAEAFQGRVHERTRAAHYVWPRQDSTAQP